MITPNKLPELLKWKKELEASLRAINKNYQPGVDNPLGYAHKVERVENELKVCNSRIEKLGNRYNIVRVFGVARVAIKGNNSQLMVNSKYEMYYSDCSLADAQEMTKMEFGSLNIISMKSEILPTKQPRIISK